MRHLCLFRHGPVGGSRPQDAFDLLLTLAAFDQEVEVLLLDDGVWQLSPDQQPRDSIGRNLPALWRELDVYGIPRPWVEEESLSERGLGQVPLLIPVRRVKRSSLPQLLQGFDRIVGD